MKVLVLVLLGVALVHCQQDLEVQTTSGWVRGFWKSDDCRAFFGIPYAAPPLGKLRFSPPRPVTPWPGTLNATHLSPPCPQPNISTPLPTSEDCLTLNIYAPAPSTAPLPVLFWIHGGGFLAGASSAFDATSLATRQAILIVTLNYRLGILGFLQNEHIAQEDPHFPTLGGMNGVADQWLALQWVKANVAAFGGDPARITLGGESAGSVSACYLLSSPLVGRGLFQNSLLESGPCVGPWGPLSSTAGLAISSAFMQKANAGSLEDLRSMKAEDLVSLQQEFFIWPSIDNFVFLEAPSGYFLEGSLNLPPGGGVIVGANSLDTLYAAPWYQGKYPETPQELSDLVVQYFGKEDSGAIFQLYPPEGPMSPRLTFQTMNRDVCVMCPTKFVADSIGKVNPVYLYEFGFNPVDGEYEGYAVHFAEVPLVFGVPVTFLPFSDMLSGDMMGYWGSHVALGDPNELGSHPLHWPLWSLNKRMFFDVVNEVRDGDHDDTCAFWNHYINAATSNLIKATQFCFQNPTLQPQ